MTGQRGIPHIQDVADALLLDPVRSVRIERDIEGEHDYCIVDELRPVAWAGGNLYYVIRLPERVIEAIKERC